MKPDLEKYLDRLVEIEEWITPGDTDHNKGAELYAEVVTAICDVLREMRECRSQSERDAAKRQAEAMGPPK